MKLTWQTVNDLRICAEVGTDGLSMAGSLASNEGKSNSGGSDSGLGSSTGESLGPPAHKHKHVPHGGAAKKAGSDSDSSSGSGAIASPELD